MKITFFPPKVLEKTIADHAEGPVARAHCSLLRQQIRSALQALPARHASALVLGFGLEGSYRYTLEEMARILKTSREYARALSCNAIDRLRHPKYGLRCFVAFD